MFKLTVVTPEKKIVTNQEISEVTVPAFRGELNILPGHAPLITILGTGALRWKFVGSDVVHRAVVSGGYCQVSPEGVNVLGTVADLPEEVDAAAKTQFIADADKKLLNNTMTDLEFTGLIAEIERARADIEMAQHPKT